MAEQNGDAMRDPEMCFEIERAEHGTVSLNPWYFRNDYLGLEQWSRNIVCGRYVELAALHEQHRLFAETWDNNLRSQGFSGAFTEQVHSRLVRSLNWSGTVRSVPLRAFTLNRSKGACHHANPSHQRTEYRDVPLSLLNESKTNPRRTFELNALKELAESIKTQGVLSPLLVRLSPKTALRLSPEHGVTAPRRWLEQSTVPVRVVHLSDAEALAAQLVENLIRAEIHPMEEAQGFRALLDLEEPKYTIEQIAAKVGKAPSFVAQRPQAG